MIKLDAQPAAILVVDDDEAARLMMSATLEKAGFIVFAVADCASARDIFYQQTLDIILLDVLLPDGDGFSLCKEFLSDAKGKDLPIAMVTGLDDLESIQLAYETGAIDFITKPVSWGTLPYRIKYILQASRAFFELSLSESKTRALLSSIPDIIMRIHNDGRILDMQVGSYVFDMENWFYFDDGESVGRLPPEVFTEIKDSLKRVLDGAGMQLIEFQWSQEPERIRFWEARFIQRDLTEALMVVREITQRKKQESQLRLWAKVIAGSNEAILITDADFQIISVNSAYKAIMGYAEDDVLNVDTIAVGVKLHTHSFFRNLVSTLKERGHWQGELMNMRKNGEVFPCWFSISQVNNQEGAAENYIAIFNDITEHKNSREKIEFLASHDSLTKLPNRVLLNDRLDMAITSARRQQEKIGVLFIDLDRFKNVNDSLGHAVGDQLLIEAARRLAETVRSGDTVARLGGDEFVVLIPNVRDEGSLADLTLKLSEAIQEPYTVDGIGLHMTPSIGIAMYPDDGDDTSTLIKNADAAMYLAKEKGRNNFQFYKPALNARTLDRLKLENDFRQALDEAQFELYYQPQIRGEDRKLVGVESLIRWRHPVRGLVSPADFIPLAEETGLIIPMGDWVIAEAARQVAEWQRKGMINFGVSVNISALQFRQNNFLERVQKLLEQAGVSSQWFELELTESMLVNDMQTSIEILRSFQHAGFRIAIDDFGTGFSSLNYLRHLPIDVLKIDQSFVRDMLKDAASLAIVESIIGLAHSLGKATIAEGVETAQESEILYQKGCRIMQGYYFAKPMTAANFEQWLKDHY